MSEIQEIHIDWEGPHALGEVQEMNSNDDYGVYQFYGHHPAYGTDALLYIGKAQERTFAYRKAKRTDPPPRFDKYWTPDAENMRIYVGRLAGRKTPSEREWSNQIHLAEQLLIYAHSPAWNSRELNLLIKHDNKLKDLFDVHVFNWGAHRSLLPEVSGRRYARDYPAAKNYKIYGAE